MVTAAVVTSPHTCPVRLPVEGRRPPTQGARETAQQIRQLEAPTGAEPARWQQELQEGRGDLGTLGDTGWLDERVLGP
ncbi:hypothetical protein P7K49_003249 [Saguinus oedipus]|uniref:Uncharacterized protein n=1 Tax=Saguinus oedipus TaxID=9490 RepID=A0ABQ9WJM3_SAGOE|nr:hypothetical protein P7K49_003249 [Saguinus oedipus]